MLQPISAFLLKKLTKFACLQTLKVILAHAHENNWGEGGCQPNMIYICQDR